MAIVQLSRLRSCMCEQAFTLSSTCSACLSSIVLSLLLSSFFITSPLTPLYTHSSALVCDAVDAVVKAGGRVSVVVADYPHPPSGAAMVQRLNQLGVPTYYRLVTDLSHIMSKVCFYFVLIAPLVVG